MAITFEQYLQSLLQSITTYYTATYSSDTELYNILRMYSSELTSGSITLETVRNNLFIVSCENSKLYDNFGTHFNQNKYTDQTYVEDRYISGSGIFKVTTPTLKVTQVTESSDEWEMASHSSPLTNFPSTWSISRLPGDTVVFDNKFISSCKLVIGTDQSTQSYYDLCIYDPINNQWTPFITSTDGEITDIPKIGLNAYQHYIERGQYSDQEYLYYLTFTFTRETPTKSTDGETARAYIAKVAVDSFDTSSGYSNITYSDIIFYPGTNGPADTWPNYSEFGYQTWSDSVIFHDKLYFGICLTIDDTPSFIGSDDPVTLWAPDTEYRYPLLFECDPITMDVSEVGLATYMGNTVGNINFQLHAMAKHDNKLWIDSSPDETSLIFNLTSNNSQEYTNRVINAFETSGSTIFAASEANARLLYSIDDGDNWNEKVDLTYMNPASGSTLLFCREFDAQDGSGSFLYVGTNDHLVYRARAPHTSGSWEIVGTFTPPYIGYAKVFKNALIATGFGPANNDPEYIYRTTNGTSWTQVNTAPVEVVNKGGFELEEFNGYLYSTTPSSSPEPNSIIRSFDGITWENAIDSLGTAGTSIGYRLVTHNNYLYTTNALHHLIRTTNGTTWNTVYIGFTSSIGMLLSYRDTLYAGLHNGELWSSKDNGETFTLFQKVSKIYTLDKHKGFAFCGTYDYAEIKSKIYKWSSKPSHDMTTYDGINFDNTIESPASPGDNVLKMYSYNERLYAILNNSTGGYFVRRYDGTSWSTHHSFEHTINTMYEHDSTLIISTNNGDVFYLNTENDTWQQYLDIPDLTFATKGVTAFASYAMSPTKIYSFVDDAWYSSEFLFSNIIHYTIPGAGVSGSTVQYASIPGYRKQLDFMLDAAVHGGTHLGIVRASNAFTLINPDIREAYTTPQWKLKSTSGPITQLSSNVWQFSSSPSWRDNLWQGAHATFVSGSSPSNKITVGYVILVNDNNTVDVGPIYDLRLLLDLMRPN